MLPEDNRELIPRSPTLRLIMEEKAPEVSAELKHNYVGTEHMMLAMIRMDLPLTKDPDITELFQFIYSLNGKATSEALNQVLSAEMAAYPPEDLAPTRPFTPRCKKLFAKSEELAKRLKAPAVTLLHFFFALIEEGDSCVARVLWENFGIGLHDAMKAAARKTTADLLAGRPEPGLDIDLCLILERAKKMAIHRGVNEVRLSHLFLALADMADVTENV